MARPSKCRICGYRFKGNEDICPECFTARDDDISCRQFEDDDHTHGSGFSTDHESDMYSEFRESSFVDEQKREEAQDPIPNSTYGGKFGTPPPTYAQQSYNRTSGNNTGRTNSFRYNNGRVTASDRLDALNSIRNGTFVPRDQNMAARQGFNSGSQFYTRNALQQRKRSNGVVAAVVIIFIIAFFMPIIIGIVSATSGNPSSKTVTTKRPLKDVDIVISKPDVSIPDIRAKTYQGEGFKLTANKIYLFKPFDLNVVRKQWGEDAIGEYTAFDEKYKDKARFMSFVLTFETEKDGYEVLWNDVTVEAYSVFNGSLALSQLSLIDNSEDDKKSLYYYTADNVSDFKIHVPVKNKETGEETICDLTLNTINVIAKDESYGTVELDTLFESIDVSADQ